MGKRDYIDYTELQRRGILKTKEIKKNFNFTKEGFVDLTNATIANDVIASINNQTSMTGNATNSASTPSFSSFWNDVPGSNVTTNTTTSSYPTTSYPSTSTSSYPSDSSDVNSMKLKVEDLEFKLDKLNEKLENVIAKLQAGN